MRLGGGVCRVGRCVGRVGRRLVLIIVGGAAVDVGFRDEGNGGVAASGRWKCVSGVREVFAFERGKALLDEGVCVFEVFQRGASLPPRRDSSV